jgi:hypothetical protein
MTRRHVIHGVVYPYKGWAPYCGGCPAFIRMTPISTTSWRCTYCGATHIGTVDWLLDAIPHPDMTYENERERPLPNAHGSERTDGPDPKARHDGGIEPTQQPSPNQGTSP